jgi:DHA1 family bicyclomycin/chloramphenicol resistance-like MFS transporter
MTSRGIHLSKPGTRRLTVIAALLAMIGPFSIDTYLPSFPAIEAEFGVSRAVLLQSLGVYLFATAVSTLAWGPLADRIGRRLVVMISMTLYTLGSMGCALSENIEVFMFFRVAQGLASSGGFIAGRAMIRDAHDAESAHRAMSQVMLLFALAPAVAPVMGGWLHDFFGWRSIFWFLSIFGSFLAVMGYFMTETLDHGQRRSIHPRAVLKVYISAVLHRRFPALILCLSLSFAGLFLYIAGAPTVMYNFLGLGSADFGWLFIPIVAGLMLGALISGRLAHRWPAQKTISIGMLVMLLASAINILVANLFPSNILTVVGPLVLYVGGLSLMMPAITVLALDCLPTHRGTAASMQGFMQMSTNAIIASFAVPMLDSSWMYFVLGQVLFLLLAMTLWLRFGRQKT